MPLNHYQKKRNFNISPEPVGKKKKAVANKPLSFFIQKHAARRLHFDLRLEIGGVLKSWAVPKEITMEPGRHLAIMVEDHPFEYGSFEGIIPKGNYGAGTVEIWDKGKYYPVDEKNEVHDEKFALKSLQKGKLTFLLKGKRLSGEFALVKFKKDEKNNWLLIKAKDKNFEINELLKRNNSNIDLSGEKKFPLPSSASPMLATLINEPFNNKDWIFEVKWDGYRTIAIINNEQVTLLSRNGKELNDRFKPIVAALSDLKYNIVIDGETVAVDEKGRSDFQKLQNYMKTGKGMLAYYVFDILYLNGRNLKDFSLEKRREILKNILPNSRIIKFSDSVDKEGIKFFKEAERMGLEGIIAKHNKSVYEEGKRAKTWLKIKVKNYQDAVIGGYTDPRRSRSYFGALILGVYENGKLIHIGNTGTGFSEKSLKETWSKLKKIKRETSPFSVKLRTSEKAHWVEPRLVCEVIFREWTEDGLLRQPVFYRWREDKDPKSVTREKAETVIEALKSKTSKKETETIVDEMKIKFTNLNKVFWPDTGVTKGDVITYYEKISDLIIPYLTGRPESMNRFPNGIMGENFYHKNLTYRPPNWVRIKKIYSKSNEKNITYLVCDNKATLLYMANLGCIEINPWHSRVDKINKPDYAILDLDPNNIGIRETVQTALVAKNLFDELGVKSYVKTSGGRGLHIYLPMGAKYDYDQVVPFMKLIAIALNKKIPEITSLERSVKKKQGRVYLDYLQNNKGQTIASIYSLRPKPGASVSTPLFWEELKPNLNPLDYNIKSIFKRVEEYGDIWDGIFEQKIDLVKTLKKLQLLL